MRIAFTHNLQLSASEEEAEFDTRETVDFVSGALRRLGHEVELVEVSGPPSRIVTRLETLNPDLVFNTAEGRTGRYREAFFPGLFEQLGIPYTGSDAYVCALTLDKHLTKLILSRHGISTPNWAFIDGATRLEGLGLQFPLIVKPNFEGSSKGITQDSVVETFAALEARVKEQLASYATGLLVEEFISGKDIVVPYLEKASPQTGGVLAPAEYDYDVGERKFRIYDFDLKQIHSDQVQVRVPAVLPTELLPELTQSSRTIFKVLGVRDLGRIDFRLSDDGKLYFLEVNALPSLESGSAIYEAAKLAGLKTPDDVFRVVVASAAQRQGVKITRSSNGSSAKRSSLRVGLTYNLKRVTPRLSGENDDEAEYDSRDTIDALSKAIESFGHEVVELEATAELPSILPAASVDVVFNIAEGIRGRNREAAVPALLELLDIPYTGSDSVALAVSLDKVLAKRLVSQAGVATAAYLQLVTGKEPLPKGFRFPAVVKPVAEGSSKGVLSTSVAHNEAELRELATSVIQRYRQPALVEEYLPGREFTIGLLGEKKPRVLPPMEVVFTEVAGAFPLYTLEHKLEWGKSVRYEAPAKIPAKLGKELERAARIAFTALGCRDVARVDFRLDAEGKPHFIECNPLPGLSPGWSDLCLIADATGIEYRTLVGEILTPAIRRYRARERERRETRAGDETERLDSESDERGV